MSATQAARTAAMLGCMPEAARWARELAMVCPAAADRAGLAWEAVQGRCRRVAAAEEPPTDELRSLVAEIVVLLTEGGAA